MKKLFCVLLAASLLWAAALAETDYASMSADAFAYYDEECGLAITEYRSPADAPFYYQMQYSARDTFSGTCMIMGYYLFIDADADMNNLTEEDYTVFPAAYCILGMDGDVTEAAAAALYEEYMEPFDASLWREITRDDGHNAYLKVLDRDYYGDSLSEEYLQVVDAYEDLHETVFAAFVNVPRSTYTDYSAPLSFTATDLEGNAITSAELFARADYTMINIWTTWCGYCVREMPDLQTVNDDLENVQIVLCCEDATEADAEALQEAKEILEENGVTLTCLMGSEEMSACFPVEAYPTSFLCDGEGLMLARTEGAMGAEAYESWIGENIG